MSFPTMSSVAVQPTTMPQSKPLVLNEGQLFHGQIKQLFPGQMAEVQIGGQKLYAKLEVPMKAGDSYYFQVASVKPELQLKIISGPISATEGQARQMATLMDSMQLPKTAEMQELLSFVLKNKIPMTREGLLQAEALLKSVPPAARSEALVSIQKMAELKLPFNETVFRSLFGVEAKAGLHTVISVLKGALATDTTVAPQIKEAILSALGKVERPFAQATGRALLGQSLLTLLNATESSEARFATVQMLKSAGVLPDRASLANLQHVLTSLLLEGSATGRPMVAQHSTIQQQSVTQEIVTILRQMNSEPQSSMNAQFTQLKALISSESTLSAGNKETLTALVDRATNTPATPEAVNKFVRDFGLALTRISAENTIASPFSSGTMEGGAKEQLLTLLGQQTESEVRGKLEALVRNAERSDNPAIQKLMQSAEVAVASAVDGKAVKDAIQAVVRSFGMNYEAGLLSRDADIGRLAETLKPQLLALMQDPSVSQSMREARKWSSRE